MKFPDHITTLKPRCSACGERFPVDVTITCDPGRDDNGRPVINVAMTPLSETRIKQAISAHLTKFHPCVQQERLKLLGRNT